MTQITVTLKDDTKADALLEVLAELSFVEAASVDSVSVDTVSVEEGKEQANGQNGQSVQKDGARPLVDDLPISDEEALLDQEVVHFEEQHGKLVEKYLGEYIAMVRGEVIGHHTDLPALIMDVEKREPDAIVLYRQVERSLPPTLLFRSPRMVRE